MTEFLTNNYEWLFSGIGVFVISIIGMTVFRKNNNNKNEQNIQSILKEEETEYNIDAKDAMAQMKSAPPYQRKEIEKNLLGHSICWEVSYSSVTSILMNTIDVMALYKGDYPWVYFKANIKEYPFLKIAKKDELLKLKGKITKITDGGFEVKISKIESIHNK